MTLRKRRPGLVYPVNEDWHYVGEAGEPAFGTGWENNQSDYNLAFRIREAGIVDIEGYVRPTSPPASTVTVFTLPVGYRPSATFLDTVGGLTAPSPPTIGTRHVPVTVVVETNGNVSLYDATDAVYPVFGNTTQPLREVMLTLQLFLNPADAP